MTQEMFGLQAYEKPLVGKVCIVPRLTGRGRLWTSIVDQSPCGKFIRLKLGGGKGKSRWIAARDAIEIREGRKASK